MSQISNSKIHKHYNKFVLAFFVLAIIIVLFTAYFAFANTVITIIPAPEKIEKQIQVSVINDLDGQTDSVEVTHEYKYSDLEQSEQAEEGHAKGTVTIINNYSADQPMVASTRLLSEDGVLFRTQQNIVAPAGGSIEVEVEADQIGAQGDIDPTKFEIVALNSVKKDQIYGESSTSMTGGLVGATIVTEEEINKAKEAAETELLNKAKEQFDLDEEINIEDLAANYSKLETSPAIGEKASSITVTMEASVDYVKFNKEKLTDFCTSVFRDQYGDGYTIILKTDENGLEYTASYENDEFILTTLCEGWIVISPQTTLIDKEMLTNKTEKQIKEYLEGFNEIHKVNVKLSPFWIKTSSFIKENVKMEINDLDLSLEAKEENL